MGPVPYGERLLVPEPANEFYVDFEDETAAVEERSYTGGEYVKCSTSKDTQFITNVPSESRRFTRNELCDLVRDLNISKQLGFYHHDCNSGIY